MYRNITTSSQISTSPGTLDKIIINSHTGGTFKLINGTATQTAIGGTYTPAAGSSIIELEPLDFDTGLFVSAAGTIDMTVVYNTRNLR